MRAHATQRGFYSQLRPIGDEFDCPEDQLGSWMQVIEPVPEPESKKGRGRPKKAK